MDYSKDQHWPNRRVNDLQGCVAKSLINHLKKYLCFVSFPNQTRSDATSEKKSVLKDLCFLHFIFYLYIFLAFNTII